MDLSEAIDTEDASFLDNTEFTDTDAVPLNSALPNAHYLVDEVDKLPSHTPLSHKCTSMHTDPYTHSKTQICTYTHCTLTTFYHNFNIDVIVLLSTPLLN